MVSDPYCPECARGGRCLKHAHQGITIGHSEAIYTTPTYEEIVAKHRGIAEQIRQRAEDARVGAALRRIIAKMGERDTLTFPASGDAVAELERHYAHEVNEYAIGATLAEALEGLAARLERAE